MTKQTITVDLGARSQSVLGMTAGGIHHGEITIYHSGRQTGKSMLNQWFDTNLCKEIFLPMHPVTKPKYQFSRAKWHTVDIGGGGWRLGREYNEIIEWCTEHFGKHPNKPDAWSRWWVGVGSIYFRDEKDFVFYKLKWS
jgi:hypothetical protein